MFVVTKPDYPEYFLWSAKRTAEAFAVTPQALAKWAVSPVERRGRETLYFVPYVIAYREGRHSKNDKLDLTHERARLAKSQADKTELEVEVLQGNLLPGEVVSRTWGDYVANCRARLISLPSTAAPRVIGTDMAEAETELRDLIYAALDELKDYDPSQYGGNGSSGEADKTDGKARRTAAKANRKPVGRRKKGAVKRGKRRARKVAD